MRQAKVMRAHANWQMPFRAFGLLAVLMLTSCQPERTQQTVLTALKSVRNAYESCDVSTLQQLVAPHQRHKMDLSDQARAEAQCRDYYLRDQVLIALQTAEGMKPQIEKDGTVAIFNLDGMGFPAEIDEFRFIRTDGSWYILDL